MPPCWLVGYVVDGHKCAVRLTLKHQGVATAPLADLSVEHHRAQRLLCCLRLIPELRTGLIVDVQADRDVLAAVCPVQRDKGVSRGLGDGEGCGGALCHCLRCPPVLLLVAELFLQRSLQASAHKAGRAAPQLPGTAHIAAGSRIAPVPGIQLGAVAGGTAPSVTQGGGEGWQARLGRRIAAVRTLGCK
eukprot:1158348-Pelagomonas_calceolata.AAC.2